LLQGSLAQFNLDPYPSTTTPALSSRTTAVKLKKTGTLFINETGTLQDIGAIKIYNSNLKCFDKKYKKI
jgi:hypothetical protein